MGQFRSKEIGNCEPSTQPKLLRGEDEQNVFLTIYISREQRGSLRRSYEIIQTKETVIHKGGNDSYEI